ncbi:hypothetical protein FIBSPDRAFT_869025 [Athelia psychrophila]|nr:hypothetical protein FIBSPDRAFT_869025 [Fibularhizoctonia sp. CBS 109695]
MWPQGIRPTLTTTYDLAEPFSKVHWDHLGFSGLAFGRREELFFTTQPSCG